MSVKLNSNYRNLKESYLFSEIGKRVRGYRESNPDAKIISLGIGDVTLPLTKSVIKAMEKAVSEMADKSTFRGYAPEYGYDFIRSAVSKYYKKFNVDLSPDEVFVSDGAKCDIGNITEIFGDNEILIPDPVYPVYLDSNLMFGRKVTFLKGNEENSFLPMPDNIKGDGYIIYICSPNNPTGAVYSRLQLKQWVNFAQNSGSVIIFDSAYESYIKGDYPHSIYEIEGAEYCAIEVCSLSKTAGFTGTRCGWSIFPDKLEVEGIKLSKLWARRQATKFNGVPYVIQRAAEAALSEEGQKESSESVQYYMGNAALLAELLTKKNIKFTGGISSPYIWLKCPGNMSSWEFFDYLLNNIQVVGTPGAGFGECGEGYFRLTSFGSREATIEAIDRLNKLL